MHSVFTKKIYTDQLINHLSKNLESNEKCLFTVNEFNHNDETLYTLNLATISRYFNMKLDIVKLELDSSGITSDNKYFNLDEILDFMFNIRRHFDPTLRQVGEFSTFFNTNEPHKREEYEYLIGSHFSRSCDKYIDEITEHLIIQDKNDCSNIVEEHHYPKKFKIK